MARFTAKDFEKLAIADYRAFIDEKAGADAKVRRAMEQAAYNSITLDKMVAYIVNNFKGTALTAAKSAFKAAAYKPLHIRERVLLWDDAAKTVPTMTKPSRRDDGSYTVPKQAAKYMYVAADGSLTDDADKARPQLDKDGKVKTAFSLIDAKRYFCSEYFPKFLHEQQEAAKAADILADW